MYLREFPNINWIRQTAANGFARGKDVLGNQLPADGWPNVILKVNSTHTERDNIKGPFSLFYNLKGRSLVGLDNQWHSVSNHFYCLSNQDQHFSLHIPREEVTTTSNIHFGQKLYQDVVQNQSHSSNWLLDNMNNTLVTDLELLAKTAFMISELQSKIQALHTYQQQNESDYSPDKEYEMTGSILEHLLFVNSQELRKIELVSAQKVATRKELFKRVNLGIDFIHSHELKNLKLDSISRNCGLSKFHFIRVFKEVYGLTPSNYISGLRAKKAHSLLGDQERDLQSIALELGFSELSAITRFYKRHTGQSPSARRN